VSSVLLDTDILIEVLRRRVSSLLLTWDRLADSKQLIAYSPVSAAELWQGVRDREIPDLVELIESLECITIDGEIGRRAGEYLRQFGPSYGLGIADALIGRNRHRSRAHPLDPQSQTLPDEGHRSLRGHVTRVPQTASAVGRG
jgi:hypothetical protein